MFIEGAAIAIVYFIIRFIDMRFVSGETAPLKVIVQNVLSVYASAIIGLYTLKQFNQTAIKGKSSGSEGAASDTPVFISAPGF
jgi:multisubunit Na+/H+ antiporter MnhF subunit